MNKQSAKFISQLIGVLILIATVRNYRSALLPLDLLRSQEGVTWGAMLAGFPLWCVSLCGGIGLVMGRPFGVYCVTAALVLCFIGSSFFFLPFVTHFFRNDPDELTVNVATNVAVVLALLVLEYFSRWRRVPTAI
jgi:hypothetical protein